MLYNIIVERMSDRKGECFMATYKVHGALYGTADHYYDWDKDRKYPYYKKVEDREWTVEGDCLEDAINWFCANHPAYYMGGSVQRITDDKTEFAMFAVPSPEYPEGTYETIEARIKYVKGLAQ